MKNRDQRAFTTLSQFRNQAGSCFESRIAVSTIYAGSSLYSWTVL